MAQNIVAYGTHILRDNISATTDEGVCSCSLRQRDTCTRRTSVGNQRLQLLEVVRCRLTGCKDDIDDILLDLLVHIDILNHLACLDDILGRDNLVRLGHTRTREVHTHDIALLLALRVGNFSLQHKTVDLCLRKWIGSLLLQWVLGCQYEEWLRQLVGVVANGNLTLLHSLQQGRLHLCRRTVNLIRQYEVCKYRALLYGEVLSLLRVDQCTHNVGRKQVGGKLNTREIGIDSLCQSSDSQRLRQARHTLQQNVSVGQESNQKCIDEVLLTNDNLAHLGAQSIHKEALTLDALVQLLDVDNIAHISFGLFFIVISQRNFFGFIVPAPPAPYANEGNSGDIQAHRYPSRRASPTSRSLPSGASAVQGYHNVRK